jgi:hypothetical protein
MAANANLKRQTLVVLSILLMLLAVTLQAAPTAEARLGSCHGDPRVMLSNGKTLVVAETINTVKSNLKSITYSFHLPAGVGVIRIIRSDTGLRAAEAFNIYYDAPANTYGTDLVVGIASGAVDVSTTMSIKKLSSTVSGKTGQHILITLVSN